MKKLFIASLLSGSLIIPNLANAADYEIDSKGAHASINFKVSHLGYSFIQARFNKFNGSFSFDPEQIESAKVAVNIDTQSLDSNHAERDKHIKSDDFIDAKKFSTARFISTKVSASEDDNLLIEGDLTLHGITKKITIKANFIGAGKDPWGGYRVGFQGTTRLQLTDFSIPVMGASSYVDMDLQIEGIRQ